MAEKVQQLNNKYKRKTEKQTKSQNLKTFFTLDISLSYVPSNFPFTTSLPQNQIYIPSTQFSPHATLGNHSFFSHP